MIRPGMRRRRTRVASGAPAWAPTDASVTLSAWYKADAGVTGSAPVTALADQSGSGDANRNQVVSNGTLVASNPAYGGKATITDLRAARVGAWSAAPTTPITIVVIGEAPVATTSLISDGVDDGMLWNSAGNLEYYGPAALIGTAIPGPMACMYTDDGTGGAAAAKLYVGNFTTPAASTTTAFSAAAGFDIGIGVAGVGNLTGEIAEVIIFGGVLTVADVNNLRTYLNTTRAYGIAVT